MNYQHIAAKYGYALRWETKEDDIWIYGDGRGSQPRTGIKVDESTHLKKSIEKLKQAQQAYDEIESNRRTYYHLGVIRNLLEGGKKKCETHKE